MPADDESSYGSRVVYFVRCRSMDSRLVLDKDDIISQ